MIPHILLAKYAAVSGKQFQGAASDNSKTPLEL